MKEQDLKKLIKNERDLKKIEERFNVLRPDYSIYFGTDDIVGLGCYLSNFSVDQKGRVTMEIIEEYMDRQCAVKYREFVRHPRLTKEEIDYLLN